MARVSGARADTFRGPSARDPLNGLEMPEFPLPGASAVPVPPARQAAKASLARGSRWAAMAWILAGLILPYLAAAAVHAVRHPLRGSSLLAQQGFGYTTMTCMLLGALVAARSGSLGAWVLGPTLGIVVGFIDLDVFGRLVRGGWLTPDEAVLLPTWSLLGVALFHHACPSGWTVLRRVTAAGVIDFASRAAWVGLHEWVEDPTANPWSPSSSPAWLDWFEPLVYAPAACLLLQFGARPRTVESERLDGSRDIPTLLRSPAPAAAGKAAILTVGCVCALAIYAPAAAQGPELDSHPSPAHGIPLGSRLPPLSAWEAADAMAKVLRERGLVVNNLFRNFCELAIKGTGGPDVTLTVFAAEQHITLVDPRKRLSALCPGPRPLIIGHLLVVRVRNYECSLNPRNARNRMFDPARSQVGQLEFERFLSRSRAPALLRVRRAAERFLDAAGVPARK